MEPTLEQKVVIENSRNVDLLVSAGAGSGKSTTMVKRILNHILDPHTDLNITDLLIVTFTVKATLELKQKISKALNEIVVKEPDNSKAKRQIELLPNANIYTINGFCLDLVRSNAPQLGLPASIRILDEKESLIIESSILNRLVDDVYEDPKSFELDNFEAFVRHFIYETDDIFVGSILDFYKKSILTLPKGLDAIKPSIEDLRNVTFENFASSKWATTIVKYIHNKIEHFYLYHMLRGCEAYIDPQSLFGYNIAFAREILEENDIFKLKELCDRFDSKVSKWDKKKAIDPDPELNLFYHKDVFTSFKDYIKKLSTDILDFDIEKLSDTAIVMATNLEYLYTLLSIFETRLFEYKKKNGVLTFSDCEHFSLKILIGDDGKPSKVAKELGNRFKEIYIDEYQDTNQLQDIIFSTIATPNSRFMVGDIKQAIYGFRAADYTIFDQYKKKWTSTLADYDGTGATHYLSTCFRSTNEIINTVNELFDPLFCDDGGFDYTEMDKISTPLGQQDSGVKCEFVDFYGGESRERLVYVVNEIINLVNSGVKMNQIAVLGRSRYQYQPLCELLAEKNIPCSTDRKVNVLDLPVSRLICSLLKVVDNPSNENDLLAILISPIFDCDMEYVVDIKSKDKKLDIFGSLISIDDEKSNYIVSCIMKWQEYSNGRPSDDILYHLLYEEGILNKILLSVDRSAVNSIKQIVDMLLSTATTFESNGFKGLYALNEYLDKCACGEEEVVKFSNPNAVIIQNIHQSKGLEYDYVFVLSKPYMDKGDPKCFAYSKSLGFSTDVKHSYGSLITNSPIVKAINIRRKLDDAEEALRLFYVALTRAKKKLYLVNIEKASNNRDKYCITIPKTPTFEGFTEHFKLDFFKISLNILGLESINSNYEYIRFDTLPSIDECHIESLSNQIEECTIDVEKLNERFSYVYPYQIQTKLPTKLSVSKLHPGILDDYIDQIDIDIDIDYNRLDVPKFAKDTTYADAALRGTATHLFMQFCDFDAIRDGDISTELSRLKTSGFITDEEAGRVYIDKIVEFTHSQLYHDILSSKSVIRERRFYTLVDASSLLDEEFQNVQSIKGEKVLIQGVIDCVFEDANGDLILVDYKTDSTRGKSLEEAVETLREAHTAQLTYYKMALEKLTRKRVAKALIYSFGLGDTVEIL